MNLLLACANCYRKLRRGLNQAVGRAGILGVSLVAVFVSCRSPAILTGAVDKREGDGSDRKLGDKVANPAPTADNIGDDTGADVAPVSGQPTSILFTPSRLADYVFPVLNGTFGSSWCVCRDVGTSPHIGQDLIDRPTASSGPMTSVAMSSGKVVDVNFDSNCGWSLIFKDSMDANWRYMHLNKPAVRIGQNVARGTVLGIHADYPTAACGTGAHLHLERRSAGRFNSAEEFRTCQFGRQSCYYNPVAPIQNAQVIRSESERKRIVGASMAQSSQSTNLDSFSMQLADGTLENGVGGAHMLFVGADLVVEKSLRQIDARASEAERGLLIYLLGNEANLCGTSDCIVSWVLEQNRHGAPNSMRESEKQNSQEVLSETGVANRRIFILEEKLHALRGLQGKILLKLQTRRGVQIEQIIEGI